MKIRDVIHGSISIESSELPIIDSRYFQRLRQIKQLGFAENSFPSATHNRFIHSLGAMKTATLIFENIFRPKAGRLELSSSALTRFRSVVRLAALLHDIGHGPLSHTTEFAMPSVSKLDLPSILPQANESRKATHEDFTLKMILDSGLTELIEKAGHPHGFRAIHVAALIEPKIKISDDFFSSQLRGSNETIDFRPLLKQIISSELDADRMDYLRRDSLHAGVSYGQFDSEWLIGSLSAHTNGGKCFLTLEHKGLYAFEDFLISRFHMFLMVYFHQKSVVFDEMLGQYFSSPDCTFVLPTDMEKYCEIHDSQLYSHLAASQNPWARRITERRPYRMLVEFHSGIPVTRSSQKEQEKLHEEIEIKLRNEQIHHLSVTSTSELSKYFGTPGDPIFVRYDNHYSAPNYILIEECTDLFRKYGEKRTITRLYVAPEDYDRCFR